MANPTADFPTAVHTPTDVSGFGSTGLGSTTPTHTQLEGKQEEEIEEIQKKLGIGNSLASSATLGQVLTKQNDGSTAWGKVFTYPSVFIAASNSPARDKRNADYLCDGTNDEVEIQAAIDLVSGYGGSVVLAPGTFTIQASITIQDNVRLTGQGFGSVLAGSGTTNFPIITRLASSGSPSLNWEISNLKIDGTNLSTSVYSTSTKGIFTTCSKNCRILNVWVYNTSATGIGTDFMVRCVIDGCIVENCGRQLGAGGGPTVGGNGIGIGTGTYSEESLVISNCHSINAGNNGIMFEQQNNTTQSRYMHVSNCTSQGSGTAGFRASGCKNATFIGCSGMKNTTDGLLVDIGPISGSPTVDPVVIMGCNFAENTQNGIRVNGDGNTRRVLISNCQLHTNTGNGFLANAGTRIVFQGNVIRDNSLSGIRWVSASQNVNNVVVIGNSIHNNGMAATSGDRDGILFDMSSSGQITDILITGNRIFDNQGTQTQEYGIRLAGTNTRVHISGNNLNGNKLGALSIGTASSTLVIKDNMGYNPVGPSAISVGSSPYTYTAGNSPETVYITGGTVSSIVKGGVTLFTATEKTVNLNPNQTLVVTYSGLPTMNKDIH